MTHIQKIIWNICFVGVVCAIATGCQTQQQDPKADIARKFEKTLIGKTLPEFTLSGLGKDQKLSLNDLNKGDSWVFLFYTQSACGICSRRATRMFKDLKDQYAAQSARFICVVDGSTNINTIHRIFLSMGVLNPIVLYDNKENQLFRRLGIAMTPVSCLIRGGDHQILDAFCDATGDSVRTRTFRRNVAQAFEKKLVISLNK